jgi:DNA replication and repair protein RecF
VLVRTLALTDFRNYIHADLEFAAGCTAIVGANGQGKTNIAEALSYLSSLLSFRGAPTDALVRTGATEAFVRATVVHDDGREMLIEAQIVTSGRSRVQVNRQRLTRTRDLLGVLRVSVFSPDDLVMVKGGPTERRGYLDDTLVALSARHDRLRSDLDRVLKQRASLLKQAGGRLPSDMAFTLDVWDAKLAQIADVLGHERAALVVQLEPLVAKAYAALAGEVQPVSMSYAPAWLLDGLAPALVASRADDVRRMSTTVGPHRDDLDVMLNGLATRTHSSQGEQRTMALALRLAAHQLVTEHHNEAPVLVLDDVFSELDPDRSRALLANLPNGQVVITTASVLPEGATPDKIMRIVDGVVR